MGRYDYSSRSKVEDVIKIQTSFLKKHNYFCGYNSGNITWTRSGAWGEHKSSVSIVVSISNEEKWLKINYTQTDRDTQIKKDFDYKIPLTYTPCRFGGKRWWFICPWYKNGVYCGKRVGKLYKDGDYFACRHCYNLTYEARNKNRKWAYAPLFGIFDIEDQIQELLPKIKKKYYKGKPTKKFKKYIDLHRKYRDNEGSYESINKLLGS